MDKVKIIVNYNDGDYLENEIFRDCKYAYLYGALTALYKTSLELPEYSKNHKAVSYMIKDMDGNIIEYEKII